MVKKSSRFLLVVSLIVASGAGGFFWFGRRSSPAGKKIVVNLSSFHKNSEIYLAAVAQSSFGKAVPFESTELARVEPGQLTLHEGGYYYRLQTEDGRTKSGMLEVQDDSPIVLK